MNRTSGVDSIRHDQIEQLPQMQSTMPRSYGFSTASVLSSSERSDYVNAFFRVVCLPIKLAGVVFAFFGKLFNRCILCCCNFKAPQSRINWTHVHSTALKLSQAVDAKANRKLQFIRALGELDLGSRKLFDRWVLMAIAQKTWGISDRVEQEKWAINNAETRDLSSTYYVHADDEAVLPILRSAVKHFLQEAERNR